MKTEANFKPRPMPTATLLYAHRLAARRNEVRAMTLADVVARI